MTIKERDLSMVRGDSESIIVTITENGVARPFAPGDTVYCTVKKYTSDEAKIFQKVVTAFSNGSAVIPIDHVDTKDIATGDYVYDIQVTFADGMVRTIIGPAMFTVTPEVTYE